MSINSVKLNNITVFEDFNIDCSSGVNVIVGENGTGKTTLLKIIYASCEWSNNKTNSIFSYFNGAKKDIRILKRSFNDFSSFIIDRNNMNFEYYLSDYGAINVNNSIDKEVKSIFIPTTEMLSHSKGFLAMNQKYEMPFDATQIDIIVNAELPETREISPLNQKLLDTISNIIDGEVVYENDTFYIIKKDSMKVEFSFEAEGLRKFGLLWKLIRNGLIEKDSVLIWDEPEANLNPELIPVLVDVLLELQRSGVQIFIATHSYNLAKYFEIKRLKNDKVVYHSLYHKKNEKNNDNILKSLQNNGVVAQSNEYFGNLTSNSIIEADSRLLDEVIEGNFDE